MFSSPAIWLDDSVTDLSTGEKLDVYRHQGRLYDAGTPASLALPFIVNQAAPPPPVPALLAAERNDLASAAQVRSEILNKQAEGKLGTGHGERISAPTQYKAFRRTNETLSEIVTICYSRHSKLLAKGIIPRTPCYVTSNASAKPFPAALYPPHAALQRIPASTSTYVDSPSADLYNSPSCFLGR